MSLADYLAKNYLNADSSGKKPKKRKRHGTKGLTIEEDDALGWDSSKSGTTKNDEDGPTTVGTRSAEFRKAKQNNWKTLSGAPATLASNDEGDTADAIIASAAAEAKQAGEADDEAPTVDDSSAPLMESGARAGLQTAAQLAAQLKRAQMRDDGGGGDVDDGGGGGLAQETIYRDASGRIINVAMKRAELRAQADAKAAKEAQEIDDRRGDVQKAEAAARRERLDDAKYMAIARYADDADLNRELRDRDRWNDPAAQFMEKKKAGADTTSASASASAKPLYKGHAQPNRYGIRPGHRWDGVDRSNGFEKEYFAAQNRRRNVRDLEYAWQMDE